MGDWSGFQDRIQSLAELAINGRGFIRFGRLRGFFDGGRIGQTSLNVLARQVWKIVQHFLKAHAGRQLLKDILDGHPHPPNTGLTAPLPRLDRNVLPPVNFHGLNLQEARTAVNFLALSVWIRLQSSPSVTSRASKCQ